MNEFKLLTIDELDAEFVEKLRVSKKKASEPQNNGFIPELPVKDNNSVVIDSGNGENKNQTDNFSVMDNYFPPVNNSPVYNPQPQENSAPRPIVPIGQTPSPYYPVGAPETPASTNDNKFFTEEDFGIEETSKPKKGSKGAALAGKIFSIVMLCVTVVVFLLGCFVSIFLNNNGLEIGGICFNSQAREITIGKDTIKEGDLIISKKVEASEYSKNANKPIAVPADGEDVEGCDIMFIHTAQNLPDGDAEISTYDPITSEIRSENYKSNDCYGIVMYYLPFVGGLLAFALNNAILVCALFVLMAAFWCLLLVLIEKNSKKNK